MHGYAVNHSTGYSIGFIELEKLAKIPCESQEIYNNNFY